jgi:thiamine-phosphate pyrophosphorylase
MARGLPEPPLLVITDRQQAGARDLVEMVAGAIAGGARWVSLREKDLPPAERRALLRRLAAMADLAGAVLSVHDDVDAAAELGLAAVHLPAGADPAAARARLGDAALIGVSTHSVEAAAALAARGADYVTLSPIFLTQSKPGYGPALGLGSLRAARERVPCPVVALGGIDAATAGRCLAAGAAGLAVMGPIMRASDPAAATRDILAAMRVVAREAAI